MIKVMFVDDELSIRTGLSHIIKWEEYGVEVIGQASNGEEGFQLFIKAKPDIIITDIKMPIMDGLELIRRIREVNSSVKIVIISGFDDFKYVKEALKYGVENYIIKPINTEELSFTITTCVKKIESEVYINIELRKDESVIRDNLLYRIVSNTIEKQELIEKDKLLNIDTNSNFYQVAIVKIIGDNNIKNQDINLKRFGAINICQELLIKEINCSIFVDLDGNIVIIFYDDELKSKQNKLEELLKNYSVNVLNLINLNIFISLGKIEGEFTDIYRSYNSAKSILDYAFLSPKNTVKVYAKLKNEKNESKYFTENQLNELQQLIKTGKYEKVSKYFDSVICKVTNITTELIYSTVEQILIIVINLIKNEKLKISEVIEGYENLYENLFKDAPIDKMLEKIKYISIETTKKLSAARNKPETLIQSIIQYINMDYNKDISLKTLSFKFDISTAYLGQLIKKESGIMFTDYLNNIRITEAKELMIKTSLKSNEIAIRVGYTNSNYFYRVFKKYTGEYPSDFKDNI